MSYVCVMPGDEDVVEDKPGKCRKCGMELQPIRLDSVWTCPVHIGVVAQDKPGKCPIDGRDLVPMTMSVSWACEGSKKSSLSPGTCPDGTPMKQQLAQRAHGNHNPQHGGQFFMASDSWHHLEGAYYTPGVFRLYLYDDFTKPLAVAKVRAMNARLLLTKDGQEVPLVRNGRVFEAKLGKLPFPAAMQVHVQFEANGKDNLFDFTFERYSKDVVVAAPTVTSAAPSAPAAAPARSGASGPPAPNFAPAPLVETIPSGVDPALVPLPIPDNVPEMLAQLRTRTDQIRAFIDRGAFASVYVPAFQAKDVALAIDAHKGELPPERQKMVSPAVSRLVRTAYLLDAFGDLGNKQQISEAFGRFAAAVKDIESAFPRQADKP
ncbi:MAG: heavy metal-binding domain-containing protein [Vicinamibacterales bacterium]